MSLDIKSMILKKDENNKSKKRLVLDDINHDLIISLLAIPVYGKKAHDEEILSIIINTGHEPTCEVFDFTDLRKERQEKLKSKKYKKDSEGHVRDENGFIVLMPR